jgi:hypothetical protein
MKQSTIRPLIAGLGIAIAAFSVSAQQAAPAQGSGPGGMMAPGAGPMMQGAGPQGMGPQGAGPQGAGPQGMGPRSGMGPRAGGPNHHAGDLPQAVIDQLKLTPDQKALLDTAQKARSDMRAARLSSRAEHQKAMEALYATDPVDPRAMMALAKQERAKMEANMAAVQEKWLTFWDGLTVDQKKTASAYLKSRHADHVQRMQKARPQS